MRTAPFDSGCHWSRAVFGGDQCRRPAVAGSVPPAHPHGRFRFPLSIFHFPLFLTLLISLTLSLLILAPPPTLAQDPDDDPAAEADDPFGYEDSPRTRNPLDIQRAEILAFARAVPLTPDQRAAALRLYDAYAARYRASAEKFFEYEQAIIGGDRERARDDESVEEKLSPVREDFAAYQQTIKSELLEGLQQVLTPEQAHAWSWFERRLRLREARFRGWYQQRAIDLSIMLEEVLGAQPSPLGALDLLDRYSAELDSVTREAEEARRRLQDDPAAIARMQDADEEARAAMWAEWEAALKPFRVKTAEILDNYFARLRAMLDPEAADALELRVLECRTQSYIGDDNSGRLFRLAGALPDLTNEQRDSLKRRRGEHQKARLEYLRVGDKRRREAGAEEWRGWSSEDFEREAERHRKVIGDVRAILTESQCEAVGPPLAKSRLVVPEFDDEDDPIPPAPELPRHFPSWIARGQSPIISPEDLPLLTRAAKLTPQQTDAARDLIEVYALRFRTAVRRVQSVEQTMMAEVMRSRGDPDRDSFRPVLLTMSRYQMYKDGLAREVESDLRTLLTSEQEPGLLRVLRATRRREAMQGLWGMAWTTPGAGVELDRLAAHVFADTAPPPEVDAILERYEIEAVPAVDVLVRVNEETVKSMNKVAAAENFREAMEEEEEDEQEDKEMFRALDLMRDLNIRTLDVLVHALPPEQRELFEDEFHSAAISPINYFSEGMSGSLPRTPEGFTENALILKDLTEAQRQSIDRAMSEYRKTVRGIDRGLFRLIVQAAKDSPDPEQRMSILFGGNEEFTSLQNKRSESRDEALKRLSAILTDDQRAQLPPPYRPPGAIPRPVFDD